MAYEHVHARRLEHALVELSELAGEADLHGPREVLHSIAVPLVEFLTAHVAKGNEVLYPLALRVIDDEETWARLEAEADAIGLCSFTPGVAVP